MRAILVEGEGGGWESWSPLVPGVRVHVTPLGQCVVADTALVRDVLRMLRLFSLKPPDLVTVGVTQVFRGHFRRAAAGWDLEQWHTLEDDMGAGASGALLVLECLQRAGPRPLKLSSDSNIYGRLAHDDLERLFIGELDELDLTSRLTLQPGPAAGIPGGMVPVFASQEWTRPPAVVYPYGPLYDAVNVAAREVASAPPPTMQTVVPMQLGALDLVWPHQGNGLLILSVRWPAGVHREDQPLLAKEMDEDVRRAVDVVRLAAGPTAVLLTEAARKEMPGVPTSPVEGEYYRL